MALFPTRFFKDRADWLIWTGIFLYSLFFLFFLLQSLGALSLWMDEGFHYLAAKGILGHGYPLFPSGHVYYKAIFYTYVLAFFSLIFGLNAFSLRLVSLLSFLALLPVTYLICKKFFTKGIALLSVLLLSLSIWQVEYARAALYFAPLQLFYFLSLYFFYLGYFEEKKKYRYLALVFFLLTPLIHQLGEGVWFCFPALLLLRGAKRFFKKDVLISFSITSVFYALIQLQEFFFWKVGYVYERTDTSVRGLISYFFSGFSLSYFKEFYRSFPKMSLIVAGGFFLYLGSRVFKNREKDSSPNSFSQNWFYLNLSLLFPLLFLGFFRTHIQPRYLAQLYPLFVILFLICLYQSAPILIQVLVSPFYSLKKNSVRSVLSVGLFLLLVIFLIEGVGPRKVSRIIHRKYGDPIEADIITRSGRFEHYDHKSVGEYARHFLQKDDLVIAIHVVFQYIYTGRVDYWLWTGGPGTWDAWEKTPEGWKDFYVGARWINSLTDLQKVIDENPDRRIWVITCPSILKPEHIRPEIANFIRNDSNKLVFRGKDGMSEVYLWHEKESKLAGVSHTFEAEWFPVSPGRIEFSADASKECALLLSRSKKEARPFAVNLSELYQAGRYRCVLRLKTDDSRAGERLLGMAVIHGKKEKEIRSFFIRGGDFRENQKYEDFDFYFYLNSEGSLQFNFLFTGQANLWFDYLDVVPIK
jgi:hypothetical protein